LKNTVNTGATKHATLNWVSERKKDIRPWSEFLNYKKFGCPSVSGIVPRVKKNLDKFLSNYLCVFIILLVSQSFLGTLGLFLGILHFLASIIATRIWSSWKSLIQYQSQNSSKAGSCLWQSGNFFRRLHSLSVYR
jgi:hypothetical protein